MTSPQNHIKLALIALTAITVAACGGGSDGGSDPVVNTAPAFSDSSVSIEVAENTTGVIYTTEATDAQGNSINYSLSGGEDQAKFSIGTSNGELQFQDPPDYENPSDNGNNNVYEVQISASDSLASSSMTLTVTITDVAEETDSVPLPTDFAATAGDANVTLTWTPADSTTYTIYRSSDSACEPTVANISTNCSAGAAFVDESSGFVDTGLSNGTTYYYWLEATGNGATSRTPDPISATPERSTTSVTPTGALNDTGITWGGDYSSGNNSDCSSNISAPQDCHQGRDADSGTNDDSDGHGGFSFTKLDSSGNALTASATNWSCVQDNVTDLIWEVKTDDGSERDKDNKYRWGGLTAIGRDSSNREGDYYDDWNNLVNTANSGNGLCGFTDWRVPDIEELRSIVDYSRTNPSIDINYFPNTRSHWYWSASPYADVSDYAWLLYFFYGSGYDNYRIYDSHVRLVRSGQ